MPKIGASQLFYQQIFLAYKTPFYDATHNLPTLIAQLPSVLTGKLSHIPPFVLLTARCDWKEEKPLARAEVGVTDRRAEATVAVCAAPRAARTSRARLAAAAHRRAPPGASRPERSLPNNDPRLPMPPEGAFPPSPGTAAGSKPVPPPQGLPCPKAPGMVQGRPGPGRGAHSGLSEPLRRSPTFLEAETAAAGAADRVPGQGDSPRP